jgi:citrate synthase
MPDVQRGLEGVVAFETEIAEPDKEGSALRYRGVDIEELVGRVPFEKVWGLLVDGRFEPGLPPPSRTRSRCTPATSALTCRARSR